MIYIFSSGIKISGISLSGKAAALGLGDKPAWAKILQISHDLKIPPDAEIQAADQVYLDISGLSPAELKSALAALKKNRAASFWGIIDPNGEAEDPALFFFEGGRDYIGPALVRKGLSKKRFAAAEKAAGCSPPLHPVGSKAANKKKNTFFTEKLPDSKFEGWKSLRSGTPATFFFLFVSLSEKSGLRARIGESVFSAVKNRLRDVLRQALADADALLWIETEDNCVFLVPPIKPNARAAVEASLKMILNSRLIGIEKLGLSFPLDFTIALHRGETIFHAPGKTGAVVSEPVNYIFHLGTKKAEAGRLTISDAVPEDALPEGLLHLFSPAGVFEGIPVRHSGRFIYK